MILILLIPVGGMQPAAMPGQPPAPQVPRDVQIFLPLMVQAFTPTHPEDMVFIPAGNFVRGCDAVNNGGYTCEAGTLPSATVYLDAFYIDRTEVTNEDYQQCVAGGGCTAPANPFSATRPFYYGNPVYAQYPVIYVSWDQANAYCQWAGRRLPTEAEWEKGARGSTDTQVFPWGEAQPSCSLGNLDLTAPCVGDTTETGHYPGGASPYGLLDMEGNAWEWVNDWYDASYYSVAPVNNPSGPVSGINRVMRGGAWTVFHTYPGATDHYRLLTHRYGVSPDYQGHDAGFRCAWTPADY